MGFLDGFLSGGNGYTTFAKFQTRKLEGIISLVISGRFFFSGFVCGKALFNTVPLRQTRETLSGSEKAFFPGKCKVSLVAPNIPSFLHRGEGGGGRQSACRKIENRSLVFFRDKEEAPRSVSN